MITEDYCSFEVAKLLKEKGFDCLCNALYDADGNMNITPTAYIPPRYEKYNVWLCPTHQMAMKWLRENYKLNIIISINDLDWFYSIIDYTHKGNVKMLKDLAGFNSYESACEAAILECLTNLI